MDVQKEIRDIEGRLQSAGVSITSFCVHAKVSPPQWWRWKRGETMPNTRTWERIKKAAALVRNGKEAKP